MISNNISTISDLRFKTKDVFKKALKKPVFLFNRSTPQGVLLSIDEYNTLMGQLEDYFLSIRAEEYEKENKEKTDWIPEKKLKKTIFAR